MKNIELEDKNMKDKGTLLTSWERANHIISCVTVLMITAVFPLAFRDYYYDMLDVKYIFYYGTIIFMAMVMLITSIIFLFKDFRYYAGENYKTLRKKMGLKSFGKTDWAMIGFLLAVAISTFQSDYFYESFWGNEGRYMGMFLILLYSVSFFIISHCLRFKRWLLDAFLASGMVVCIIGIMQFFKYDPIGFKIGISPFEYSMFASTIGNINTYTSYISLIVGIGTILFLIENNKYKKIWYLFTVIISLFALITGMSDNAYLTLMALFGLLPLYLFNSLNGVKKYMVMVSILFTEFQFIDFISNKFPNHVLEINGFFNIIVGYDKLSHIIVCLWGGCIVLYILTACMKKENVLYGVSNVGRWIWLGIIILIVLAGCYILYDVNIAGNADKYGSLRGYLVIGDDWGTRRGYIWRIGMESYLKFPIIHKIFGYGPDTFGIITVNNYYGEMLSKYNTKFDSAHNEYLQYLITIGIVGLAAYLSLLFVSIMEMVRASKKEPVIIAIIFAIVCYSVQALVNISVPIVAPIMMTLLMVGISASRKINREIHK
ncbi:O-antigen polymerase [Clostridiales bacterium 1_7_47FAA]|uniref:O-antigen ligase family protein n=1 Tax=Enterocloster hominis (ex Hitch et al. 2024) TaxID=1917870 RepID=A0ABV1D9C1_9FIRM|nr:O-antigen polymerase [Clostridiales bacterium 1_7_47FAA]